MSSTNPFVTAAAPELIAVLSGIKQFTVNIGVDPALWPAKLPGALAVLIGTAQLQLPAVAQAEVGAVFTEVNSKIDELIKKLQPA